MTTTAKTQTTPADVDLDTRLTLAAAGMDAIIEHKYTEAMTEARAAMYAAQAALYADLMEVPAPVFEPNPVLAGAARLIEQRGWCQNQYVNEGGQLCAMGAVREAAYGSGWPMRAQEAPYLDALEELLNRIAVDLSRPGVSVTMWNDRHCRTQEDVLRLLY